MLIRDVMIKNPVKVYENELVTEAVERLRNFNLLSFPVLNSNEEPVGIFMSNVMNINGENFKNITVGDIMRVADDVSIVKEFEEAYSIFAKPREFFFVLDDQGRFVGILRKRHVMKTYYEKYNYCEARAVGIMKCVDSAVFAINKLGQIVMMNENAGIILGIGDDDVIGMKIESVIPNTRMLETLELGEVEYKRSFEYKEKKLLVNRHPIENEHGIIGAICSFRDVTEYNEIQDELVVEKHEKEVLETIFEIAYDGLIVIDPEGYITMISNAYKKFLGVEDRDVIGMHVTEIIENTRMHKVAETGVAEIAELQKINNNHTIVSRIPVFKDGVLTSVVGKVVFRNIDELDDLYSKIGKMEEQLENYKRELSQINKAKYTFSDIIGRSSEMKQVVNIAKKAAYTNSNVLILGESGTGKELFAHSIHNSSARRSKAFVKVNCAAIPDELLESELFGYEQGAFTGAKKGGKIGKFEVADQGTIFLDEIGDMPMHMQAKLLRVIQEREIEKIGSNNPKRIDVRIIAATNRNIEQMIEEKKFRLDLYYRLNVVTLNIPPLRERTEDIDALCKTFIEKFRIRYLKRVDAINDSSIAKLKKYGWPGNIRELENIIERAINIMDGGTVIKAKHLPVDISGRYDVEDVKPLKESMDDYERKTIIKCLEAVNFNKSRASKLLGISRTALYEKLDKYDLKIVNKSLQENEETRAM
ncbi:PAS domain S-box-containing protein [Dethiosulfatibacter aminovorans DSM 17477]|uniref:PAS domain S-box-containing protein n=1 Tax=Dethiosulfatibacter aminovorans DSM 17477 TaxID=1121476 RepID=A0A1M6HR90_9FIRM|nr:sigma-54-dependent Fis family transcriptional regulator [Dethiosulfatibacter aminovorans]SHJ24725.1 PAS domain S-box-containing protein [Dethiosulfatibacter aminovorans DSM 17477]